MYWELRAPREDGNAAGGLRSNPVTGGSIACKFCVTAFPGNCARVALPSSRWRIYQKFPDDTRNSLAPRALPEE